MIVILNKSLNVNNWRVVADFKWTHSDSKGKKKTENNIERTLITEKKKQTFNFFRLFNAI